MRRYRKFTDAEVMAIKAVMAGKQWGAIAKLARSLGRPARSINWKIGYIRGGMERRRLAAPSNAVMLGDPGLSYRDRAIQIFASSLKIDENRAAR